MKRAGTPQARPDRRSLCAGTRFSCESFHINDLRVLGGVRCWIFRLRGTETFYRRRYLYAPGPHLRAIPWPSTRPSRRAPEDAAFGRRSTDLPSLKTHAVLSIRWGQSLFSNRRPRALRVPRWQRRRPGTIGIAPAGLTARR